MPTPEEQAYLNYVEAGHQTAIQQATFQGYVAGGTQSDQGARATLSSTLEYYNLDVLGNFAWEEYISGIPMEQIMLDIRNTQEYKTRFPAMEILAKRGQAITESQYINYENSAKAIFKQAGLPEGFYDQPDDFTGFFTKNLALPELQDRVQMAQAAVFDSNPEALQALSDYYAIGGNPQNLIGDLTAYFIDPNVAEPLIKKQWAASQVAGMANRAGYGGLSQTEAERLGGIGVTADQALQGFTGLSNMRELFTTLPGETMDTPTREQGFQAAFEGNAIAQQALQRQQRRRAAAFQGGSGFQQTQGGYTGAG